MQKKRICAFKIVGGKFIHLNFLLPFINSTPNTTFIDAFGGSGSVILNKNPSKIDVYNDLNSEVVRFFRTLREKPDEIIEMLKLTPYSREEFCHCVTNPNEGSDVEIARKFYTSMRQIRSGKGSFPTCDQWSCEIKGRKKDKSKSDIPSFRNSIEKLKVVCEKFLSIQIENLPAIKIIQKYDYPDALFYLDPPYLRSYKKPLYKHEMLKESDHKELIDVIKQVKGKVILSGYDSELYNKELSSWRVEKDVVKNKLLGGKPAQEILWLNY